MPALAGRFTTMPAQRLKISLIWAMAAFSLVSGAVEQYFQPGQSLGSTGLVNAFLGVLLVFLWYRVDAEQCGYRRSPGLNFAIVGFTLFGLPYYFFRSRGWRSGAVATLVFLLAIIGAGLLHGMGTTLVYHLVQR